ncbi:hypothetical protein Y032_0247g53 [Ancylostoma ceylanicum]|uniref:DNA replication complex GINS protein PSF3 n=1 Tax=Ancylostoma ceylanicum TaxID=53326 RepID=A0A016SCK1_9BILA|nr:hypothetical protein Y032_0247g53 [Ancylostoma ceylanicum]
MAANEVEVPSDFYDIDSLLSRSTRVTCTYSSGTPRDVYDMLGTTAPHFTDEKGYKVLTPFWFVRALEPFCSTFHLYGKFDRARMGTFVFGFFMVSRKVCQTTEYAEIYF